VLDVAGTRPEAAYALHVAPGQVHRGVVATRPGPLLASADRLLVTVRGASGHGARPHLAVDPVPVAAEIVTALSSAVTRQFDVFDPVVLSVGLFQAGTAHNVIAGSAHLEATLRTFGPDTRERLARVATQVCRSVGAAHGVEVEAEVEQLYPPTVNDEAATVRLLTVAERLFGAQLVETFPHPLPGAEDFSFVLEEVPGALAFLGVCIPERDPASAPYNHSSRAIYDDDMLGAGAQLLTALALEHLAAD
jgi:hippurate hydrolase